MMNDMLEPQLISIAKQQINDAISTISIRVLNSMEFNSDDLIIYKYDENENLVSIEYDTKEINNILDTSLKTITSSLIAAQEGKEDPKLNKVFFENGVIFEIPIGYFTRISFLQDKGFPIKIGMRIYHYISGDIEIKSAPYGINNSLIKVYLNLKIKGQAITTLYTKEIVIEKAIPIIVQVVQGKVPSYTPYIKNE